MAKKRKDEEKDKAASASHRRELEKLFSNGADSGVPKSLKSLLEGLADEVDDEELQWRQEVTKLKEACDEDFRAFVTATSAFQRAGHRLPDDEDLLARMLDHPDERVICSVLEHLIDVHARRTIERTRPIKNRLSTITMMSDDPRTLDLVKQIKAALGGE